MEDAGLHLQPCSSHVLCPCRWLRRMIQFKEKSASQVNISQCTLADTDTSCLAEAPNCSPGAGTCMLQGSPMTAAVQGMR